MSEAPLDITGTEGEGPDLRVFTPPGLRERARQWLAFIVVGIFGFEIFAALTAVWFSKTDINNIKDIMELIFAPTIGLVGGVVGFYFGSETRSQIYLLHNSG
jgi:hypothetical protein